MRSSSRSKELVKEGGGGGVSGTFFLLSRLERFVHIQCFQFSSYSFLGMGFSPPPRMLDISDVRQQVKKCTEIEHVDLFNSTLQHSLIN